MLATEKKQSYIPPVSKTLEVSTPLKLINVTGSKMRASEKMLRKPSDDEEDLEGYEQVPSFNKTFGDAIAQALQQAEQVVEKTG